MALLLLLSLQVIGLQALVHVDTQFGKSQQKDGAIFKGSGADKGKSVCWQSVPEALLASSRGGTKHRDPGAGIEPFAMGQRIYKDGYMLTTCVKDDMFSHGDKFGDNRYAYQMGEVSNVSVVLYEKFHEREDREHMTPEVCYEFCRTVPEMSFFGLTNGRTCYCSAFYKEVAGDSSDCDVLCEGDQSQMCGGKTKSSIFEMHMCQATKADVKAMAAEAGKFLGEFNALITKVGPVLQGLQTAGDKGKAIFGQAGNPVAVAMAGQAMEFAGEIHRSLDAAQALASTAQMQYAETAPYVNGAVDGPAKITGAERLNEQLDVSITKGLVLQKELEALYEEAHPEVMKVNHSKQYYPAMYFADSKFAEVPSICGGVPVGKPKAGLDLDGCAYACNAEVEECVGFSFFDLGGGSSLCFLLSELTALTYYTGCDGPPAFLQLRSAAAPFPSYCMAKLSRFDGKNIKPDPTHKCETCLNSLEQADRCYGPATL